MEGDEEFMRLREYVDRRLGEFREELLDYLDSMRSRSLESVRKEVVKILVREIEDLRRQLLNEVGSGSINDVVRRLDELGEEINELRRLISSQSNQPSVVDVVRREVGAVEARLRWLIIDKINEVEARRRREGARRAVLLLLGVAVGIAVVVAVASELAPWLIPLIIIAALALVRR